MPAIRTNIDGINACIKSKDFTKLKAIGIHEGFSSNNTQRVRCYSILLGCGGLDAYDQNGEGRTDKFTKTKVGDNTFTKLIHRDVERNGYSRWDKTANYSPYQRKYDLAQIEKLLNVVFTEYPELNYIQSFDSVFALFYLIANGNLFIAKRMIVAYLHIFRSDLALKSGTFGHLSSIWAILRKHDHSFAKWLQNVIGDES